MRDLLEIEPALLEGRPGQIILADQGYASAAFEAFLGDRGATLVRPAKARRSPVPVPGCSNRCAS